MDVGEIDLTIPNIDKEELVRIQEILFALVTSGGLSGVKGGKTIIHFDKDGIFQGIELDYWPWRRRVKENVAYGRRSNDETLTNP
jgi:hypothetical protein